MRALVCLFFCWITMVCFSQNQNSPIILKSFVKKDTVLLRWITGSAELMVSGLKNGYVIDRISNSAPFDANPTLKTSFIAPFNERASEYLASPDQRVRQFAELVGSLISNPKLTPESLQMAYVVLMLGASTDKYLAQILGVFFTETDISDKAFTYRVSIQHTDFKSEPIQVNPDLISQNAPMSQLSGSARPKLKQAYLSWEALSLQKEYSAYWVERSTDSINFVRRNNVPYLFIKSSDEPDKRNCDFVDTNVTEGQVYYYRITGINHFAELGQTSNIVRVYVPKSIYGEVRIDSIVAAGHNRTITGNFIDHRKTNDIAKFVLYRSDSIAFGYTFLAEQPAAKNNFDFTTTVPIESGDRYYYRVAAVSPDNDTVYSYPYYFFTLDQIPPSTPEGLQGIVNDSGIVRLTWQLNPENDIRGYRVFRSNSLKEEFVEVTKVFCLDSVFLDTLSLNNLTHEVYYRIAAVDLNYNNSKTCAPVLLYKPDTIPPVSAVFIDYQVTPTGVTLAWNNSSSNDILQHYLIRKNGTQIDTLLRWADSTVAFKDSTGVSGSRYDYIILTTDKSQNVSFSSSLRVNFETGVRQGVTGLQATVNRELKQITLMWTLPADEIYSIQIYRAKNQGPFTLYKTIRDGGTTSFIDSALSMNNVYHYKIKVVYKTGISSILSEPIQVTY